MNANNAQTKFTNNACIFMLGIKRLKYFEYHPTNKSMNQMISSEPTVMVKSCAPTISPDSLVKVYLLDTKRHRQIHGGKQTWLRSVNDRYGVDHARDGCSIPENSSFNI